MGRFSTMLMPLLALAPLALASYMPPEESAAAAAAMATYSAWYNYAGPTGTEAASTVTANIEVPAATTTGKCGYWLEDIKHQGTAAFNTNSSYTVFRNVKQYGAKGDGVTDDTAAIQRAISEGGRFSMTSGQTSSNTPALVYIPAGTYLISCSIEDYYFTQIIGNPNCMPTFLASPTFGTNCTGGGVGLIDGDQDYTINPTNIFYRQIQNLILDTRQVPASSAMTAIHWPTAQATSLQNVVMLLNDAPGTQHTGFLAQSGSAGFLTDVVISGGYYGMNMGNQQWTMRNISISNSAYCILITFDWGWTFQGLNLDNCTSVAIDSTAGAYANPSFQGDNSVIVIDSKISNSPLAFNTGFGVAPAAGGQLVLENVALKNVTSAVFDHNGVTALAGGTFTIDAWMHGHAYTPTGPQNIEASISPVPRPSVLTTSSGSYYTQSKPQYANLPASEFVSVRLSGAKGNGKHDDTNAIQKALNATAAVGQVLFMDQGTYIVTRTIYVPPGARIVGEAYAVIMSSGAYFNHVNKPQPVVQVGVPGDTGRVEWQNMIVSTQGGNVGQIGAILIEWNLDSPAIDPSGMWDVHTRIGGTIGSNFEGSSCPTTPGSPKTASNQIGSNCYAAFMSMHITSAASGLYLENNWFWTADHDIDSNDGGNQITVYTGRGLLSESPGPVWLWGTAVEHHTLYQYSFVNAKNHFMGQIQTETAYWQPNPNASVPFADNPMYSDPIFPTTQDIVNGTNIPNADGWGLRAIDSELYIYGAGHYSFFDNYSTDCSAQALTECQSRIVDFNGSTIYLYDLHTVGSRSQITLNGVDVANYSDNLASYTENIGMFRTG